MDSAELVEVAKFINGAEAELAKAMLASAGIDSLIASDNIGGMYPGANIGRIRLLVRKIDEPDALEILS